MEAKILNFPDAMNLATILSKYKSSPTSGKVIDYVEGLLAEIEPIDYFEVLRLLKCKYEKVTKKELLYDLIDRLQANRINYLVTYYAERVKNG